MRTITDTYARLAAMFGIEDYGLLFLRAWAAKVFFLSGRTKAGDGFFDLSDQALYLFQDEYRLPLLSPEVAGTLALYAETIFPVLLLAGFLARPAALGLLGMTLVIQIFVYPGMIFDHATWAAALVPIVMLGAGRLSLDYPIGTSLLKT